MLIGVVSGVLLASGIALLAGLAAAGIAASIASLTYTKRKGSEAHVGSCGISVNECDER